ncbi:MAG: phage terminase large subunit family protein, partial [Staphylococcus equorum]|nr:phage terminase large subunit family protein [Staphylococcus equorum]
MSKINGKELKDLIISTYGTTNITQEQLDYVLTMASTTAYMLKHNLIRGHNITFSIPNRNMAKAQAHRPWQIKIINDDHPNIAVLKSRQLGLSEVGYNKMLHFADTHSRHSVKAMFTFPTSDQMQKFVQSRINPTLQQPYFSSIINHDNDSLKYKQIRNSSMFFRTSSTPKALEGVDIDYLSLDEYDRVPSASESSAIESMSSSPFQIMRRWSTPTTPNMGIHKLYMQSDQWYYGHRCEHCNYLNEMSFDDYDPDNLDKSGNILLVNPEGIDEMAKTVQEGSYQFVCQKCGKLLDRWYNGEWHAKYPERTKDDKGTRGYFITQLNAVWISASELKQKEMNEPSRQLFHNYTLGMPFEDM